jgi:hypothetical protein
MRREYNEPRRLLPLPSTLLAETMYHAKLKAYPPARQSYFPRSVLQPARIALVAVVVLLFYLVSQLPTKTNAPIRHYDAVTVDRPAPTARGFGPLSESRIAMVTFTTEQKSFTHLSLKNKARRPPLSPLIRARAIADGREWQ